MQGLGDGIVKFKSNICARGLQDEKWAGRRPCGICACLLILLIIILKTHSLHMSKRAASVQLTSDNVDEQEEIQEEVQ